MQKLLSYLTLALVLVVLFFVIGGGFGGGGVTNYDSLDLLPIQSSENALVVRNSDGTAQLTVSGSGGVTFASGTILSSTLDVTGETHLQRLIQGGTVATFTSSATVVTAAEVCASSVFSYSIAPTGAAGTLTLPTKATLDSDCLSTNGDMMDLIIINTNANSASTVTVTAGTSTTLVGIDGNADVISGGDSALLKFVPLSSTELWVYIADLADAD